jgi:carboxylate-amine ligase
MDFMPSAAFSVGMELELQLLDPITHDLAEAVLPLLATYSDRRFVKPEFLQNTVEVVSPVAADLRELEASLRALLKELLSHLDRLGLAVCGGGTHPFHRKPASYTPSERYRLMERNYGWLGQNQVTFATHVHLGLASGCWRPRAPTASRPTSRTGGPSSASTPPCVGPVCWARCATSTGISGPRPSSAPWRCG